MQFFSTLAFAGLALASPIETLLANRAAEVIVRSNETAGAIKRAPSGSYTSVVGTFNIPNATQPAGSTQDHISVTDIGIGTNGPHGGCLVASENGRSSAAACYAGWEVGTGRFQSFPVQLNDPITVTARVTNATAGTVSLRNGRTGQTVSMDVTAPSADRPTRGESAAFTVNARPFSASPMYQNFRTVSFSGISTSTTTGPQTLAGADIYQIFDSAGRQIARTTIGSGSAVSVVYVGPQ